MGSKRSASPAEANSKSRKQPKKQKKQARKTAQKAALSRPTYQMDETLAGVCFKRQSIVRHGATKVRWIQAVSCVQLWDSYSDLDCDSWKKCTECHAGQEDSCSNVGYYFPQQDGSRGFLSTTLPTPSQNDLPINPPTLSSSLRRAASQVFTFATSILECVKPPGHTTVFGTKALEAVSEEDLRRCDECKSDIFPIGARCGECSKDWCRSCFNQRDLQCNGTDQQHKVVAVTLVHNQIASSLVNLAPQFPSSYSSLPSFRPPLPFNKLPPLPVVPPKSSTLAKLLGYLKGKATLLPEIVCSPSDQTVEIERHLEAGVPASIRCELGAEWGIDGKYWAEMKKADATWTENNGDNHVRGTINEFLDVVGKKQGVKLADFSGEGSFQESFPITFAAFTRLLPHPMLMAFDGLLNLASTLYSIVWPPDLGPKGYIASEMESTGIHVESSAMISNVDLLSLSVMQDASDAANIPVTLLSSRPKYSRKPIAVWFVFDSSQYDIVSEVLATSDDRFPLHSFRKGLSVTLLEKLGARGVVPRVLFQYPGMMIIIPAGSAHEVHNLAPVAKLAVDFFPAGSLARCLKIQAERIQFYGDSKGDLVRAGARVVSFLTTILRNSV